MKGKTGFSWGSLLVKCAGLGTARKKGIRLGQMLDPTEELVSFIAGRMQGANHAVQGAWIVRTLGPKEKHSMQFCLYPHLTPVAQAMGIGPNGL